MTDLVVRAGTALDFSVLADAPAGKHGPVLINPKGQLAFAARPDEPVRFLCNNENMPWLLQTYLSGDDLELMADQYQRAGYNVCRPQNLDVFLMTGAAADGELNPAQLALWDGWAAALKKRGVYLYLDLTTYGFYHRGVGGREQVEGPPPRPKMRIYWDTAIRATCAKGIRTLLNHVNPYTGLALKDDPQVLVMQFRNESGLAICLTENQRNKLPTDPGLLAAYHAWLQKRYRTTEALRRAWTVREGGKTECHLKAGETIETVDIAQYSFTPAVSDFWRFTADIERETLNWFMHLVKDEIGARMPVTDYNLLPFVATDLSRALLPVVDNHSYHDGPTAYMARGSRVTGESTLASTNAPGHYLRLLAGTRHLGAPFLVSEVGQPFWTPWRHEIGLFMPAFAGLQDWQMISQHGGAIAPRRGPPLKAYITALDPPCKAAERMSALLYRRGDVSASPHRVEVRLDPRTVFEKLHGWPALPDSLTQLSLLMGFGVRVDGVEGSVRRAPYRPDLSLSPTEGLITVTLPSGANVLRSKNSREAGQSWVRQLRQRGVLPVNNRTDLKAGIYESDTGQIKVNAAQGVIEVVTPRSEGATLTPSRPMMDLPTFAVTGDKTPATVFLSALDGKVLKESERMLLIIVSDAKNTGMSFADEQQQTLETLGEKPVLARVVNAVVSLKNSRAGTLKMWALAQNGTRGEEIPLETKAGRAIAHIDTGRLVAGPTPYFEIATASQTIKPTPAPSSPAAPPQVTQEPPTHNGRIMLFDGKTLNGWHLRDPDGPGCWSVEKGELTCLARKRGQDLITDKVFQNFELQLEFLLEDASNSGVYLRGLYELQLNDDNGKVLDTKASCGAIFGQIAPSEQAYLGPGRWNTLKVKMVGQSVTVTMNGKCVIGQVNIRGPTDKMFALPIKEGEPGPIILQCWAKQFRFRNITIREID